MWEPTLLLILVALSIGMFILGEVQDQSKMHNLERRIELLEKAR